MTSSPRSPARGPDPLRSGWTRILMNKVPEVTVLFWVVTLLSATVGETMAHVLTVDLALGLPAASAIAGLLLAAVLIVQFSLRRYRPAAYWTVVVVAALVATLLHADLVDELGVRPWATTAGFSVVLAVTCLVWFRTEHTVSIHTIVTRRREAFYWLAILLALTLGTSVGDLLASTPALVVVLALVAIGYRRGANPPVMFWAAYVVIRPLGAAFGTFLADPPSDGDLGLGTTATSLLFLAAILLAVAWFGMQEHHRRLGVATRREARFPH